MQACHVDAEVLAVEEHPLPYYTLSLRLPEALGETRPGQFVMVQVEDRLEPYLRRAFSVFDVSRGEGGATVELLGKVVGRGTALLARQRPGNRLPLLGPLGEGFRLVEAGPVALVAGGVGSAGLMLLARRLAERGIELDFFYGGRSAPDLARREDFGNLARDTGGRLILTTEDGSMGSRGLLTEPLDAALAEQRYRFVYCCGPTGLMAAVAELCRQHRVAGEASLETPMGCGYGACLGCAVAHVSGRFLLCCKDGPVFPLDEVVW